jgi:polyferredoxin
VGAWGAWFLWALFAAILVWEEVWDLPNSSALSAWLLLIITAGAMVCSWFFERRLWCRCMLPLPVGFFTLHAACAASMRVQ